MFTNVSVKKEANIYYEGKVTSRTVTFEDGSIKSLGIIMAGEYEFATADKEIMEIMSGDYAIKLEGESKWKSMSAPSSFEVRANSKFGIKCEVVVDYCCSYIKG
jgi:uncharacterized protein YaiE (UPF0345 family)